VIGGVAARREVGQRRQRRWDDSSDTCLWQSLLAKCSFHGDKFRRKVSWVLNISSKGTGCLPLARRGSTFSSRMATSLAHDRDRRDESLGLDMEVRILHVYIHMVGVRALIT
jgi:hypothetical protein